ncbi:MAG: 2TM domain-containing protein [Candidatus Kapaibacteriota bacterium]
MERRLYTKAEVEQILAKVIKNSQIEGDKFSLEDILSIARELNLDLNLTLQTIKENELNFELERAKQLWKQKKKRGFYQHLSAYAIINLSLISLELFVAREAIIFTLILMAFWGVGLIADFMESFYPSEIKVEKAARKILTQQKRKDKINTIIDSFLDKLPKILK